MMGCDPARLGFLRKAKSVGLGDYDLETIEIIGELKRLTDFKLPPLGGEAITHNEAIQAVLDRPTLIRPRADEERCTGCGACVDQCPVSALLMNENYPIADPEICIRCFYCQEICPEKAMALM